MSNLFKLNKFLLLFTIGIAILGCSKSSKHHDKSFTAFPVDKTLKIELDLFFSVPAHVKAGRIFLGDDFIVLRNDDLKQDSLFLQYSLTGKLEKKYVQQGTKQGMAYAAMSSGIVDNKIWFHDLALSKVVIIDPKSSSNAKSEFKLKDFAYSTQLVNENTLLTSGFYHSTYLLEYLNLSSGKVEKQIGQFIPPDKKIPFFNWKAAYESFLFLRPNREKAVLAGRYSDNIEIFDLVKKSKLSISGPENFEPDFKPATDSISNDYKISFTKKSKIANTGGFVTEKYIYLLYAGIEFLNVDWIGHSDVIHVFDWNGKPIERIKLDKKVKSIAVSKDDKILYTVDGTTGKITKTENFL
ncbi:BF3164 family lipoprotein [Pedobacter jamesrossensis]|uniref:BF3164 family lipoprotein n=1 Tax=Pedobacter jamesrossensis TaxID=1908238 RepID=A0ABV8NJG6_9SPHI